MSKELGYGARCGTSCQPQSSQDLFLYKLNSGGGYLWGGRYGNLTNGGYNYLNGFANHNDLMFITGWYTGTLSFNNTGTATGTGDIYVARIHDLGNLAQPFRYVSEAGGKEEQPIVPPVTEPMVKENSFNLYPVPAKNSLNVEISLKEICTVLSLEIYDLAGKKVYDLKKSNIQNEIIRMDVSTLNAGIYLCKINTGNDMVSYKVIIQ